MPSRLICPSDTPNKKYTHTYIGHTFANRPRSHTTQFSFYPNETRDILYPQKKKSTLVKPAFTAHHSFVRRSLYNDGSI